MHKCIWQRRSRAERENVCHLGFRIDGNDVGDMEMDGRSLERLHHGCAGARIDVGRLGYHLWRLKEMLDEKGNILTAM
jgi:hypothetical protein